MPMVRCTLPIMPIRCARGSGSFELRVFIGIDPDTHRRRYRSMTVRANRAEAERELAAMVATVQAEREVGVRSTVGERRACAQDAPYVSRKPSGKCRAGTQNISPESRRATSKRAAQNGGI